MIRAGRGGVYASDWLEHGVIGIGWDFDGADIAAMNREQIRAAYGLSHPGDSKGKVAAGVGQVYRFAHDMTTDSTVVMYDPESRLYHLGVITGPCVAVCDMDGVTYTRDVTWGETAPRDVLSPSSKNSLGGIQTIFAVSDEVMADLTNAARDKSVVASNDPAIDDNDATNDEETLAATYDNGIELIKDRVNQLDWEDMERLVAGLLKAMGYCARVMPKGPDGGRDVVASPDALGLESPRIVAEVKHRKGAMGAQRFAHLSVAFAQAIAVCTCLRAALRKRHATRPIARTFPCAYSIWMPSCGTMSKSMTRPMTTPVPFFRSPVSGGQHKRRHCHDSTGCFRSSRRNSGGPSYW